MKIRITESELKALISESVKRLIAINEDFGSGFDESFGGGFDEEFEGGFDEAARKRPSSPKRDDVADPDGDGDTSNDGMQRKRSVVINMFSNKNKKSRVKRRGAIEMLYHPKDEGEWNTYRSEFSKYLDPNDTAHVWDDSQINKLYNWLSDTF
jgi:hypothetical protein